MGVWQIFYKNLRASLFNDDYRISLISAGSISLDSTFKRQIRNQRGIYKKSLKNIKRRIFTMLFRYRYTFPGKDLKF